jgi:hypothetical protein
LLPAPKGTARRPRGTVRRRTADGMALQLFAARRKSSGEQSKRGQGRQPRTEEDRRLAGVPACRNRVAEIGSRTRGSQKLEDGPLPEWTSFFERAGATPRGDHLGTGVERRLARALRVTGRSFHRTNPLQLVGAHAKGEILRCEQPGSMTCSKLVHALPKPTKCKRGRLGGGDEIRRNENGVKPLKTNKTAK